MAQLRRDPVVGRWVIVDTDTPGKPGDFEKEKHHWKEGVCPFCYGNEGLTPPEIEAIRQPDTKPDRPGWQVRVVPNKFPALQIEGELNRRGVGLYDMSNGTGAHEVIIQAPFHHKEIPDLTNNEVFQIIQMCCRRSEDLKMDRRFKYIMLFKNYGFSAGVSLAHPHLQLIALPMIPKNPSEELEGALDYFEYRQRCLFCDMLRQEIQEKKRIVAENKDFVAFCPFVSRFTFEIWVLPRVHNSSYCDMTTSEMENLAQILKEVLSRLRLVLSDPAYNFIIHTAPINMGNGQLQHYHWHIEIMPKLTRIAGFEWGTGFYVCSTPPEMAAKYLRETK
ncbi:MAG: galactose-1-phosphate uridylyltransferase [Candidatus Omnitrophica bacterium]|nr:galactose-1-phosphate uridylyltransferase [Candidatus Omnitrophota bacterium]